MNKKRGFSLIELLAVIVVLAIILAIAVPKVLTSINTASKKAFTSDVDQFVGIAKLEYNEKLEGNKKDIYYIFESGEQTNVTEESEIHFKGESPYEGYILITEDGKVELELVSSNQKWCASKELEDEKATVDKCETKEKEDINLSISTTNTTKSITVTVSPSNLDTYYYSIDDSKYVQSKENIKIYNELDNNKAYKIKVKGCRKNNVKCETKEKEVTLPKIDAPKYTVESTPEDQDASKGWATSRTVTINYSQTKDENTDYSTLINQYIYASTTEELNQKILSNEWINCVDDSNVTKDSCTLSAFTSDAYVIARVTDEHNTVTNSSILALTNFDTENPTAPVITGGSSSWTSTSRTISVETASQAKSGIKKYQYYVSTSSEEPSGGSWKDCSTSTTTQKFTTNGAYYIFFKAISNVGLESDPSNYQIVKVDNVEPTVTLKATKTTSATSVSTGTWSNETLNFTLTKGTTGKSSYTIYYCADRDNTCTPSTKATSGTAITTWASTTGTYYFRYYVKGGSGLKSSVTTYTANVDTTIPTVSYDLTGGVYTYQPTITVTGSDTNFDYMNVHVYKYDGSSWGYDSSKSVTGGTSKTYSVSLTTGRWIVYTQVYDKAGNRQNQTPDSGGGWYYQEYIIPQPTVTYKVGKMGTGSWSEATDGAIAGTTGDAQAIDQFQISLSNGLASTSDLSGTINYQLHKQTCGDLTVNSNACNGYDYGKRIETIRIYLSGDIANYYDVVYRVHVQSQGWLGWTLNGNWAGSKGLCKRIEAVQIKIVPKGTYDTSTAAAYLDNTSTPSNCVAADDNGSSSTGDEKVCSQHCTTKYNYKYSSAIGYCPIASTGCSTACSSVGGWVSGAYCWYNPKVYYQECTQVCN